ncbi:hypothetical protein EG329_011138 [Mollisiaceae sp. DMI_Dod_QoI]|nr:hypothetical protein EG329_011138 [Helotiales sp. DMI_Dod_QoI]
MMAYTKPEIFEEDRPGVATPANGTANPNGIVEKDHALDDSSHLENGLIGGLTAEHRDYLISRHGTADLNPLPTMDPADPLNWPAWKALAFFISPAIAISSAVVTETFFARERGQKMGIWTLMVTLGPPSGPFIMGFVAYHTNGYKWIYWTLAITNGIQFILYFFLSPETLYARNRPAPTTAATTSTSLFKRQYLNFGRLGPHPLSLTDFWTPIKMFAYPNVLLPTIAYSVIFNFTSVLLTVEIPQLFTPKYHFNAQQIGLQFIGMIVGSVLGEQLGGRGSDLWMRHSKTPSRSSSGANPEHRIWVAYPGFITVIIGIVVFCIQVENLKHYNVTPIVGIAISAFGNQIITTVLVTYAVDCHHEHAASIGVFINLVRSTWGFIGPFWFPDMFSSLGLSGSAGLMVGIIIVFSVLPTIFIQWKGRQIKERRSENELDQVRTITR